NINIPKLNNKDFIKIRFIMYKMCVGLHKLITRYPNLSSCDYWIENNSINIKNKIYNNINNNNNNNNNNNKHNNDFFCNIPPVYTVNDLSCIVIKEESREYSDVRPNVNTSSFNSNYVSDYVSDN